MLNGVFLLFLRHSVYFVMFCSVLNNVFYGMAFHSVYLVLLQSGILAATL